MKDKFEALIRDTHVEIPFSDTDKGNFINLYRIKDFHTYYHLLLERVLDTKCYFNEQREELIRHIIAGLKKPDFAFPDLNGDDDVLAFTHVLYKTFLLQTIIVWPP
ncbi:MAG: hypothetical protein K0R51_1619 [Cytophagaceae bacterium]|nr:hypothetical protein [Cytophagaceae bacterium]